MIYTRFGASFFCYKSNDSKFRFSWKKYSKKGWKTSTFKRPWITTPTPTPPIFRPSYGPVIVDYNWANTVYLWLGGHSITMWTKFYLILTPFPPRVDSCGYFTWYLPFVTWPSVDWPPRPLLIHVVIEWPLYYVVLHLLPSSIYIIQGGGLDCGYYSWFCFTRQFFIHCF